MFQDIQPHHYSIAYRPAAPGANDYLLRVHRDKVLLAGEEGHLTLPHCGPADKGTAQYLFSVDEVSFYLRFGEGEAAPGLSWQGEGAFRTMGPGWLAFAGATAFHLAKWYDIHRYCGRCQAPLEHLENERALRCPACGVLEYPKIAPVVIVGITDGDKLLLTRSSRPGYRRHALVAGFVEVGETLEDAVRREVMEEVGLEVTDIRYYNSQPWAFSESVLMGFFAKGDSAAPLSIDTSELAEAEWFSRGDIPPEDSTFSLTWTMIEAFRQGEV